MSECESVEQLKQKCKRAGIPSNYLPEFQFKEERYKDSLFKTLEMQERLDLLLEHFEIDPKDKNCWHHLSVALASKHVLDTSFQIQDRKKSTGRPTEWSFVDEGYLYITIGSWLDKNKSKGGMSVERAIKAIRRKGSFFPGKAIKTLRNKFTEIKRRLED